MANHSVYRVTDLVGTSKVSWEDAVEKGTVTAFRARVNVSFKYQS